VASALWQAQCVSCDIVPRNVIRNVIRNVTRIVTHHGAEPQWQAHCGKLRWVNCDIVTHNLTRIVTHNGADLQWQAHCGELH